MTITLATLHKATPQQVFDQVATHLLTQKKNSIQPGTNRCLYRGPENLMCAAGCLISEEEYKLSLEDKSWDALIREKLVPTSHAKLIGDLQAIHDWRESKYWYKELRGYAMCAGLSLKALEPFAPEEGEDEAVESEVQDDYGEEDHSE